jgi:hypothetical protein
VVDLLERHASGGEHLLDRIRLGQGGVWTIARTQRSAIPEATSACASASPVFRARVWVAPTGATE